MTKKEMTIEELAKTTNDGFKKTDATVKNLAMTVEELAKEMRQGFKKSDSAIEELARAVGKGFVDMGEHFDKKIESEISGLRSELKSEISSARTELKSDISSVKTELKSVKDNLESIKIDIGDIKKRTLEDDDVLVEENIRREKEIKVIQKDIKILKLAKA